MEVDNLLVIKDNCRAVCMGGNLDTVNIMRVKGFPSHLVRKESACSEGDPGSIPGLGGSPGEGNGNPLQYSCLENPMDRGTLWAAVHGVTKSQTQLGDLHLGTYTR